MPRSFLLSASLLAAAAIVPAQTVFVSDAYLQGLTRGNEGTDFSANAEEIGKLATEIEKNRFQTQFKTGAWTDYANVAGLATVTQGQGGFSVGTETTLSGREGYEKEWKSPFDSHLGGKFALKVEQDGEYEFSLAGLFPEKWEGDLNLGLGGYASLYGEGFAQELKWDSTFSPEEALKAGTWRGFLKAGEYRLDTEQFARGDVYAPFGGEFRVGTAASLQAVPEPATMAILGMGALGIAARKRRRS